MTRGMTFQTDVSTTAIMPNFGSTSQPCWPTPSAYDFVENTIGTVEDPAEDQRRRHRRGLPRGG